MVTKRPRAVGYPLNARASQPSNQVNRPLNQPFLKGGLEAFFDNFSLDKLSKHFSTNTTAQNLGIQTVPIPIYLAASPLGPKCCHAWHTSIGMGNMELFFTFSGIERSTLWKSHENRPQVVLLLGYTKMSQEAFWTQLNPFFRPGTYDLLRKNCNSFSDVAMWYLTGTRLEKKYSILEKLGNGLETVGLISGFTAKKYEQNKMAEGHDNEKVIQALGSCRRDLMDNAMDAEYVHRVKVK